MLGYAGLPEREQKRSLVMSLENLPELRERLRAIKQQLGLTGEAE